MRSSYEEHQEISTTPRNHAPFQLIVRVHWTAAVSFTLALLDVMMFGSYAFINLTRAGHSIWWDHIMTPALWNRWEPIIAAALVGGAIYTLVGWIFGLIALNIARKPLWRKGLVLATCGLVCDLVFLAVALGLILFFFFALSQVRIR